MSVTYIIINHIMKHICHTPSSNPSPPTHIYSKYEGSVTSLTQMKIQDILSYKRCHSHNSSNGVKWSKWNRQWVSPQPPPTTSLWLLLVHLILHGKSMAIWRPWHNQLHSSTHSLRQGFNTSVISWPNLISRHVTAQHSGGHGSSVC